MKIKKYYIYILVLIIAVGGMLWFKKNSNKHGRPQSPNVVRDWPTIKADGEIRLLAAYNPAEYKAQGDSLTGTAYEVAQAIKEKGDVEAMVLLESKWDKAMEMLLNGTVDIILSPTFQTSYLDTTKVSFLPIADDGQLFLVQRKTDSVYHISEQIELSGDTITLPQNKTTQLFIRHLADEIGSNIHIQINDLYDPEQLAIMVDNHDINYTVCTKRQKNFLIKTFPNLDCSVPLSFDLKLGWVTRKTSPILIDSLESWFRNDYLVN